MKGYIIMFFFYSLTITSNAQPTRLRLMQGVWSYTMNTNNFKYHLVVTGRNCLSFSYTDDNDDLDCDDLHCTLFDMIIGFQSLATKYDETEFIHVDSLKEDGLYYTAILDRSDITLDGTIDKTYCMIATYFECDGELLSFNGGKLFEFDKINELPFKVSAKLYKRGKLDKRDYIKDYLQVKALAIKSLNSKIYTRPNKQVKGQLQKDDVIIVLEESGKWIKIKYSDSDTGWIRKTDALE